MYSRLITQRLFRPATTTTLKTNLFTRGSIIITQHEQSHQCSLHSSAIQYDDYGNEYNDYGYDYNDVDDEATKSVAGSQQSGIGTGMNNDISNPTANDTDYTGTESPALGLKNTDDSRPPPFSSEELTTDIDANEHEEAASATDSGASINEMKQFGENMINRTKNAFKGESHSKHSSQVPGTDQPKRYLSTYSDVRDQAEQAIKDGKNAMKNAASAAGAQAAEKMREEEARTYGESSKENAKGAFQSAREAVSDAFNSAKERMGKFAENAERKVEEARESVHRSTEEMRDELNDVANQPRTDNPVTGGSTPTVRSDEPGKSPRIDPRSDQV